MLKVIVMTAAAFALTVAYASTNDAGRTEAKKAKTADCEKESNASVLPSLNGAGICSPDSSNSAAGYGGLFQPRQLHKTNK